MDEQENFDEEMMSERVSDVQCLLTKRSQTVNSDANYGSTTARAAYSSFDVKKLLYEQPKAVPFNSQSLLTRSVKFEQYKEDKRKEILVENDKNLMKQCTFKPKVNKSFGDKRRSIKEFLESQERFVKKVGDKKQQIKKTLREAVTESIKPRPPKKSQGSNQPVHQRLYRLSKESLALTLSVHRKQSFVPQISERSRKMYRGVPISEHLYTDAMRRQEDQAHREEMRTTLVTEPHKHLSLKTEMYAGQKFIKEFYYTIEQAQLSQQLDFESFINIMQRMGFITYTIEEIIRDESHREIQLVKEAFERISQFGLSLRNVCVFLLSLVGIHYVNPLDDDEEADQSKLINMNPDDSRKLQNHFDLLYRNRLSMQELRKTVPSEQPLFEPEINERSEVLAEIRRHKIIQQTSTLLQRNDFTVDVSSFNHVDLLHLNKINKEIQIMKRRQENREKDMKQCTFHPQTHSHRDVSTDCESGVRKCDQLYNLSKGLTPRQGRPKAQIEYEKNKGECTFKPKINKAYSRHVVQVQPAKNYQKSVVRMYEARKMKNDKNKRLGIHDDPSNIHTQSNLDKGVKSRHSKSLSSNQESSRDKEVPFLVIDINIGESVQQMIIYKDQIDREEDLARQFANDYNLDESGQLRLVDLLRMEINAILQKIDEEDAEYDSSTLQ